MRKQIGVKVGMMGLVINGTLVTFKLLIGTVFHSLTLVADSLNNLSDFLTALLAIITFKLSQKPADRKYPYGYERYEYLGGLIISTLMLYFGIELFRQGLSTSLQPTKIIIDNWLLYVSISSIILKSILAYYQRQQLNHLNSAVIKTMMHDSINDILISCAVLISFLITKYFGYQLDGYLAVLISLVIIVTAFIMLKIFIQELVGIRPPANKIQAITDILASQTEIIGFHDLLIHEYGDETTYGSVHIELDDQLSLTAAHLIINEIEKKIKAATQAEIIAHLDPIDITSAKMTKIYHAIKDCLTNLDPKLRFHDLRMIKDSLEFDVSVYENCPFSNEVIEATLKKCLAENYPLNITFDHIQLIPNKLSPAKRPE